MNCLLFVDFALLLLAAPTSIAQNPPYAASGQQHNPSHSQHQRASRRHTKNVKVTGCLQQGTAPGEVFIVGKDGKTWDVTSSVLNLEQLLGHKVTVTGMLGRASNTPPRHEAKEGSVQNAGKRERIGYLKVKSLSLITDTCPQE